MRYIRLPLIALAMMSFSQAGWGQEAVPAWSPEPPVALPPVQYAREYEAQKKQEFQTRIRARLNADSQADLEQQYLQSSTQYQQQVTGTASEPCSTCGVDGGSAPCNSGCGNGDCGHGSCGNGNCGYGNCGLGGYGLGNCGQSCDYSCSYGACSPCCPGWKAQFDLLFMNGGIEAGFDGGDTGLVVVPRFTLEREDAGGLGYRLHRALAGL